ncbi:SDR family NAD(P)-dependent oxidoreductase [Pseudonocardia sp. MH-G8]|uniref:SDR family NAD(P)-dependent oxidoreductase n=1 Tax=Pseudonocardia sp. MH-G8 TaxID=1854588 RepID=UPI001304129F|nr:SDR family oxidoreductase [Pseudonocardia sp. MH-G8]
MSGVTAVITGGASGIGAAVVESLAADGVRCVVVDLAEPAAPVAGVEYLSADVSTEEGNQALLDGLAGRGIARVEHLVHCAAVLHYSSFRETERAAWQRVLRVNLEGTIAITQTLVPLMGSGGRIVLFASGTVFKGPPNVFAYAASKAGVIGFARCLASELGDDGITVNVVAPGITATPMSELMSETEEANIAGRAIRRRAVPQDIVGSVRFLLSDAAAFVTGQTLCVDGGSVKH